MRVLEAWEKFVLAGNVVRGHNYFSVPFVGEDQMVKVALVVQYPNASTFYTRGLQSVFHNFLHSVMEWGAESPTCITFSPNGVHLNFGEHWLHLESNHQVTGKEFPCNAEQLGISRPAYAMWVDATPPVQQLTGVPIHARSLGWISNPMAWGLRVCQVGVGTRRNKTTCRTLSPFILRGNYEPTHNQTEQTRLVNQWF